MGLGQATDTMKKAVYDADGDSIVDKAEGVPVLSGMPADLSGYSVGDQFMINNKKYIITNE